jgi:anti-anti-sigma factor
MFQMSKQGAVQVLSGDQPLTSHHADDVTSLVEQVLGRSESRVVFDFRNIPFLDSVGLELLLTLREKCLQAGGSLQIACPGPLCQDILVATGVAEQFAIFDDLATAIGSYAR